jgi:hypothetical protein
MTPFFLAPLTSAAEVPFDCFAPYGATFVKMHLWGIPFFQSIDGLGKLFPKTLVFDFLDWIQIGLEGKNQGMRLGKPMQRLALTPKERLPKMLVVWNECDG